VTDNARLRIKIAHRDQVLAILGTANIDIVGLEERGDGEVRVEIPSKFATFQVLNLIPNEWWAVRGVVS
jgi:hypothetical protein